MALQHASPEIRDNGTIVLEAVTQNPMALEFASARLKKSMTVALTAIN
jgi:hypothetical protein